MHADACWTDRRRIYDLRTCFATPPVRLHSCISETEGGERSQLPAEDGKTLLFTCDPGVNDVIKNPKSEKTAAVWCDGLSDWFWLGLATSVR